MHRIHSQQGQSLIEILFAIALFTVGVVTVGYVLFDAFDSLRHGMEATQARLLAQEGIEAVRAIRDGDADGLEEGIFGLALDAGKWAFRDVPDTDGIFTRSVTIDAIEMEAWNITSTVTWDDPNGQQKEYTIDTVQTNWEQTIGHAGELGVDAGNVAINSSSTQISGVTLYNAGESDDILTIDAFELLFEDGGSVEEVVLDGDVVFSSASSTSKVSGDRIYISDYPVGYGSGAHILGPISFSSAVATENGLVLIVHFTDTSSRYISLYP